MLRFLITVLVGFLCLQFLTGCKGDTGPMGPPGPGTRTVYSGIITSAAASSGQLIEIADLDLSDFPLVAVYVSDSMGDWIQLNIIFYDAGSDTYPIFETAIIQDGQITLFSLSVGQQYRVVVVY